MTVRVPVTQAHLDEGTREMGARFPVVAALREATGRDWRVEARACWEVGSRRKQPLPVEVTRFMVRFSAGAPVEPLAFEVEVAE